MSCGPEVFFFPQDQLPQGGLFLVGTVHRVPELEDTLTALLISLSPALITVEISPFSLRRRKKCEARWRKFLQELVSALPPSKRTSPNLRALEEALKLPYEVRAAFRAARKLGIRAIPLDLSCYARKYLHELEDLLTPQGIQEILKAPPPRPEKEFALARLILKTKLSLSPSEEDKRRENFAAGRLKRLFSYRQPLVHLCGWRHLIGLWEKIRLPQQTRIIFLGRD